MSAPPPPPPINICQACIRRIELTEDAVMARGAIVRPAPTAACVCAFGKAASWEEVAQQHRGGIKGWSCAPPMPTPPAPAAGATKPPKSARKKAQHTAKKANRGPTAPAGPAAIVVDVGSHSIKVGLSSSDPDAGPTTLLSCLGRPTHTLCWGGQGPLRRSMERFGQDAIQMRGMFKIKWPIDRGFGLLNAPNAPGADDTERLLHHAIFSCARAAPEEHPVLLVAPLRCPTAARERATQLMFEVFDASEFFMAPAAALVLRGVGNHRGTGLVLDIGARETRAVPVVGGTIRARAARTTAVGGEHVTQRLAHLLGAGETQNGFFQFGDALVHDIKEKLAYVALDENEEIGRFIMEDDEVVDGVGVERFRCAEVLFRPSVAAGAADAPDAPDAAAARRALLEKHPSLCIALDAEKLDLAAVPYSGLKTFLLASEDADVVAAARTAGNKDALVAIAKEHQVDTTSLEIEAARRREQRQAGQAAAAAREAAEAAAAAARRPGIHEIVVDAIMACDGLWRGDRPDLLGSIVLAGGSALMPGLKERLKKEVVAALARVPRNNEDKWSGRHANLHLCVDVVASPRCAHAAWAGGCHRAQELSRGRGGDMFSTWIKSVSYDEIGPTIEERARVND